MTDYEINALIERHLHNTELSEDVLKFVKCIATEAFAQGVKFARDQEDMKTAPSGQSRRVSVAN
jgi:hypothetical protein